MNALPIGGSEVAPESLVGEHVFVVFIKFAVFQLLFLSLQLTLQ